MATELNLRLPDWYVIRRKGGEYRLSELISAAKNRIEFLFEVKSSGKIVDSDDERIALGFYAIVLAVAGARDVFFTNWLLETEADVFEIMFRCASPNEKIAILHDLFGNIVIGEEKIADILGVDSTWLNMNANIIVSTYKRKSKYRNMPRSIVVLAAVRFLDGFRLLLNDRGIVIRGWIITTLEDLFRLAKRKYQDRLKELIDSVAIKLASVPTKEEIFLLGNQVIEYWKSKRISVSVTKQSRTAVVGHKLWEKRELFPLCMRILYDQFLSSGYLHHGERLQLGLFLKALGMPLEEQLRFWYSAVDNVGMSWEEFMKKGGYYIKHIYGVEGSKKDYKPPKCETIRAKYFCPLSRLSTPELRNVIKKLFPNIENKVLENIIEKAIQHEYGEACALVLSEHAEQIHARPIKINSVKHPVQYVFKLYSALKKTGVSNAR